MSDIEYESLTQADRLAESIADSVLSGEFAPGFRLDENALAERFGVSRTPVREAIRLLASTGLIEVKPAAALVSRPRRPRNSSNCSARWRKWRRPARASRR